ncbi:hypothetical protein RB2501_05480 [Robiginitalea biformata HTCC2501]|uniref:Uncharacterized protein n=1 Tax=Robiginitalea biformata (strain ATCC BAA-864 / DSM 15991 / KCTC 12146 / HTCC2501) TaxID=313596 RepID=A4CHB6_ROBBH|nr:hypothetical protein RB2501_05480 [Robiginitalea biformata HTCC2501]
MYRWNTAENMIFVIKRIKTSFNLRMVKSATEIPDFK